MAKDLHAAKVLQSEYSGTLDTLNAARKVAVYEGDPPNLEEESLEDLVAEVETAVETAEKASE